MASAIIGGLIKQGTPANRILVVEPFEEARSACSPNLACASRLQPMPHWPKQAW